MKFFELVVDIVCLLSVIDNIGIENSNIRVKVYIEVMLKVLDVLGEASYKCYSCIGLGLCLNFYNCNRN